MEARRAALAATLLFALALVSPPAATVAQVPPDATPTATATPGQPAAAAVTDTPTPVGVTDTPTPVAVTDTPTAALAADTPTPTPQATGTVTVLPTPTVFSSGVPCATDDPSSERVQRSERHGDDEDGEDDHDEFQTGNGTNAVIVHNCTDNRLRVRAAIQLNTIPGHIVKPLNEAYAEGSCLHCQTLAVALQIDLYNSGRANDIEPQNFAVAINTRCTGCVTVSRAIQYVQGVDEPRDVSQDISDTIEALSNELTSIQSDPTLTLPDAEARLNAVMARFNTLAGTLNDQRDEHDD